jgi:hypothetical protein
MKAKAKSTRSTKQGASNVSISMVGFFDILGFSAKVEKVRSETELVEMAGTVESIRKHFEFRSKDKSTRETHTVLGKQVLAFSDCVVTAVSVQTDFVRSEGLYDTFGSQIVDMAYSQVQCLFDGYFLRGGVDIGYWYHHKGLLVSPALVGAYKEEQQRALYPVISISPRLYKLLRDDRGRKSYSKDADPFTDEFSSFTHSEKGRVHFINYLRLAAASLDWDPDRATREAYMAAPPDSDERGKIMDEGYRRNLTGFFRRHKELIESAHKAAADEKVKLKYRFLADYHNKELKRFLSKERTLRITI